MKAANSDILVEVESFLAEGRKTKAPITSETNIARDLGLDSLAVMDLLMALEDRFDISIPLNCLPDIETVSDLASTIEKIRNGMIKT